MNSMPETSRQQTLVLKNRHALELDGVEDVVAFEEVAVVLRTVLGTLHIEGEGLRIKALDLEKGRVSVEGKVSTLAYIDRGATGKGGFFSRLVK